MKKKQKTKTTRNKWLAILLLTLVGVGIIKVADMWAFTEQKLNNPHITQNTLKSTEIDEIEVIEKTIQEQVFDLLVTEGGMSFEEAMTGLMIIKLESRWDVYAIGDNGLSHGLWQIHEPSHPDVSRECKFDVICSTREAIKIYNDSGWNPWSTYRLIK